jgi:endonuclease YncB( thermonuclease family)
MLPPMRRGLPLLIGALLAATLSADASAATRRAPCVEQTKRPLCTFQDARVTLVADGDTIRVKLAGRTQDVRFTGINAMELTRYSKSPGRRRGACHGLEATAFVERAVKRSGWKVRLAAQKLSSRAEKRLRRSVWVKQGGRWRDLAKLELRAGLALWLPNQVENAHNREYALLAQRAAAARKALYDPDSCGAGPDQDLPIAVTVNWDADGSDADDLNGEWIDIHNGGGRELRLGGWWVRDSHLRFGQGRVPGHRLPGSAVVPAGETLRLHVGCGPAGALLQYWCLKESAFENVGAGDAMTGDGAYLFDPQGDLRAWEIYPCLVACSDPLAGKVSLTVRPRGRESISIANTSGGPIDLGGHLVKLHHAGKPDQFVFGYPFQAGTVLAAGETMVLDPSGEPGEDTRLYRGLGRGSYTLADGKGVVSLRTTDDLVTACTSWGDASCG